MVYIIGGDNRESSVARRLTKDQLLHDDKIQSYEVIGDSAHFLKRQKPLSKIGVYCGRFAQLTAKDAVFLGLCKQQCDLLVVLIDSDYAVRLKGDKESAPAKERAFLVASLPFIDWVCLYDDNTPDIALNLINPDKIFTGLYVRDDVGINIKHNQMVRIEHPFEVTLRSTNGTYFNV